MEFENELSDIYMASCHFLRVSLFLEVKCTNLDNKQAIEHFLYYCPRKKKKKKVY